MTNEKPTPNGEKITTGSPLRCAVVHPLVDEPAGAGPADQCRHPLRDFVRAPAPLCRRVTPTASLEDAVQRDQGGSQR